MELSEYLKGYQDGYQKGLEFHKMAMKEMLRTKPEPMIVPEGHKIIGEIKEGE